VRCDWVPELDLPRISVKAARELGRDYLSAEFAERIASGPVRFTLEGQIAEPSDNVDDPSSHWPASRRRVSLGTLELTEIIDDPESSGEIVVFDPSRLVDGISATADPVLAFRPEAYSESAARRQKPA
jgi:catalase